MAPCFAFFYSKTCSMRRYLLFLTQNALLNTQKISSRHLGSSSNREEDLAILRPTSLCWVWIIFIDVEYIISHLLTRRFAFATSKARNHIFCSSDTTCATKRGSSCKPNRWYYCCNEVDELEVYHFVLRIRCKFMRAIWSRYFLLRSSILQHNKDLCEQQSRIRCKWSCQLVLWAQHLDFLLDTCANEREMRFIAGNKNWETAYCSALWEYQNLNAEFEVDDWMCHVCPLGNREEAKAILVIITL